MIVHDVIDGFVSHAANGVGNIACPHQVLALLINNLALVVHDIVKFQQVLADFVVLRFDFLLRCLKGLVDPRMDDGLAFLETELAEHAVHALRTETAHEIIFERQKECRCAKVSLAAGAAPQLVVDASGLVAL